MRHSPWIGCLDCRDADAGDAGLEAGFSRAAFAAAFCSDGAILLNFSTYTWSRVTLPLALPGPGPPPRWVVEGSGSPTVGSAALTVVLAGVVVFAGAAALAGAFVAAVAVATAVAVAFAAAFAAVRSRVAPHARATATTRPISNLTLSLFIVSPREPSRFGVVPLIARIRPILTATFLPKRPRINGDATITQCPTRGFRSLWSITLHIFFCGPAGNNGRKVPVLMARWYYLSQYQSPAPKGTKVPAGS